MTSRPPTTWARFRADPSATFGLGQAALQERAALVESGIANLEVLPTAGQQCSLAVEPRPRLAARTCRLRLCGLVCLECWHEPVEFGDTS